MQGIPEGQWSQSLNNAVISLIENYNITVRHSNGSCVRGAYDDRSMPVSHAWHTYVSLEYPTSVDGQVVVAAGNSKADSCTIAPANVPDAITVAATDLTYKFSPNYADNMDCLYSYSNTGSCISLFAPGVDIYAACGGASAHLP